MKIEVLSHEEHRLRRKSEPALKPDDRRSRCEADGGGSAFGKLPEIVKPSAEQGRADGEYVASALEERVMRSNENYQLAVDCLAYMILWAPNYPPSMPQTFDQAFVELCGHFDKLSATEEKELSLVGIAKCKEAAVQAKKHFEFGDEDSGRVEIQRAHQYLEFAAKGKSPAELHS
jgi:hypothetical protein